jgi:hypothetical protein
MVKEWNKRDKKEVVDFILSGKSTWDVKRHFGFNSYQSANLCVWRAFSSLGIARPRFSVVHNCRFCGQPFTAKFRRQYCCHSRECIRAYHRIDKAQRYHTSSGRNGPTSITALWNFCMEGIISQIKGSVAYHIFNEWERRLQRLQPCNRYLQKREVKRFPRAEQPTVRDWPRAFYVATISVHFAWRYASISEWDKLALSVQKSLQLTRKGI